MNRRYLALLVLGSFFCACSGDGKSAGVDAATSGDLDAGEVLETDSGDPAVDTGSVLEVDGGNPDAENDLVTDFTFESTLPEGVDIGTAQLTPSQGYESLGTPGNTFGPTFLRSLTGNTITITVTNLPAHTSLSLDFLFAAIDSLDGEGAFPAGDYFRIDLDGVTVFREAFANATEDEVQTYEPPVPEIVLARHVDLGFSGPAGYYTDSAYDMSLDPQFDNLPHTASSAVLVFTLEGDGVQSLDDESWAIDNVRVSAH